MGFIAFVHQVEYLTTKNYITISVTLVMTLLALGINHKTASISLRERMAFSQESLNKVPTSLFQKGLAQGCVVLSTCNRTELYISVEAEEYNHEYLLSWLCEYHRLRPEDVKKSLYCHHDSDAVIHLMRVASGLDSLVLGEPQIFGQVKKAFFESQRGQALPGELKRLFQASFSVAKRVRTETEIGANAVSVAFAACVLTRQIFESLANLNVLLVGAGEVINLVARHLREHKLRNMIIANRTRERAQRLSDEVGAEVIGLPDIDQYLADSDIIISSTSSPIPIIDRRMLERALKARHYRPMLLVDIAVPCDIEPEVGKLANAFLYRVDDLQAIIHSNLAQRKVAAAQAEVIIQKESANFMAWLRSYGSGEVIREYRSRAEKIRLEMENKALADIAKGAKAEEVIHELAYRLTNRLIHAPTKSLQNAASDGDMKRLQLLRNSLCLDQN